MCSLFIVHSCRSKWEGSGGDGVAGNHLVLRPVLRPVPRLVGRLVSPRLVSCRSKQRAAFFIYPVSPLASCPRLVKSSSRCSLPISSRPAVRVFVLFLVPICVLPSVSFSCRLAVRLVSSRFRLSGCAALVARLPSRLAVAPFCPAHLVVLAMPCRLRFFSHRLIASSPHDRMMWDGHGYRLTPLSRGGQLMGTGNETHALPGEYRTPRRNASSHTSKTPRQDKKRRDETARNDTRRLGEHKHEERDEKPDGCPPRAKANGNETLRRDENTRRPDETDKNNYGQANETTRHDRTRRDTRDARTRRKTRRPDETT